MAARGYVAQALFDRLHAEGLSFATLGDTRESRENAPEDALPEVELTVEHPALERVPRLLALFALDLDLQLVRLDRPACRSWRCVFGWSDDVGRPLFIAVRVCSDYCSGARELLAAAELASNESGVRFVHGVLDTLLHEGPFDPGRGEWLSGLWQEDPRSGIEQVARFWRSPANIRLIAQAAKHEDWAPVARAAPQLRRAIAAPLRLELAVEHAELLLRRVLHPAGAAVMFTGRESIGRGAVLDQVARDLRPLDLRFFEQLPGEARHADFSVVFDAPARLAESRLDAVAIAGGQPLAVMAAQAEAAVMRWLEHRVQQRYPQAVVGSNPLAALAVQRLPFLGLFLGTEIRSRLRSPLLMPYPFGIVIEENVRIGSRVTVMQQVMIERGAEIGDNVVIGAGAKILAHAKIGRGAVVPPNAVVGGEVMSHSVAGGRQSSAPSVVNR